MNIPIHNVYYLLSYAWDQVDEGRTISVEGYDFAHILDLFAHVLEMGVARLLKQGLHRSYRTYCEKLHGIRGKLALSHSLKVGSLSHGQAVCVYSQLDRNVLYNQILKATLLRLANCEELDRRLRPRLHAVLDRLHDVEGVRLTPHLFRTIQLHRNNRFYLFLLNICQLILLQLQPTETKGPYRFPEFVKDRRTMAHLFERFVLNFFRREQRTYRAHSRVIPWQRVSATVEDHEYLPRMITDITLENRTNTIIIDAKYYVNALADSLSGKKVVRPAHLYQLFAYMHNYREIRSHVATVQGILLYPTVTAPIDLRYVLHGYPIRVCTINLAQDWRSLHSDMLALIADSGIP